MTTGIYDDLLSGFNNGCFPIFSLLLKMLFFQLVDVLNKVISHKRPVTVVLILIWINCFLTILHGYFTSCIDIIYILLIYCLFIEFGLRPLQTESEIFARWKINTTSRCVNHVYTLPLKRSSVIKKNRIGFFFFAFFGSVASILRGVLTIQSHRTSERQNPECRLSSSSTSSRSTKHCKDPCTLSSQELVVFFLICGSSIASKASNWATNILK